MDKTPVNLAGSTWRFIIEVLLVLAIQQSTPYVERGGAG